MTRLRLIKVDRILSAESELQPLVAKTRDLRAAAGLVHGFLPAELARETRVANIRDGQLTLIAANSAAAAKLKLLGPALSQLLQKRQFQVNSVRVRVQPNRSSAAPRGMQKLVHFSTSALADLRALHQRLAPSPARDALAKMLRRHGALED